jgi:hypothetical protein
MKQELKSNCGMTVETIADALTYKLSAQPLTLL